MKNLVIFLAVISITLNISAQAPQKMSYQCVVRNAGGALVTNQSVSVRISILLGSSSGAVVYQETYNPKPVTNANGLVSLEIGAGTVLSGTFSNIDWSVSQYFLKTETDPAGGTNYTISGTSQLLSVPYALHSNVAKTADYNSLTNLPNLSGYITTESDPLFTASVSHGITNSNITNWNSAYGWGNHTGLYRPISWVPAWGDVTGKPTFATVATSGSYSDLLNKPALFDGAWTGITGKPTTTGGYGITDAVMIPGTQTITGIKTFSNDLVINGITTGKGGGAVLTNTANGSNALSSNTTGGYNTANGYSALIANTTGNNNTSNGVYTLYSNTTGTGNTANGFRALYSNTTGNYNSALSGNALYSNTTGIWNTASGYSSLCLNTTGNYNTANGGYALYSNTTGNSNTANGNTALYSNTTGSNNTANGNSVLYSNTTGTSNTAHGFSALYTNTTGSDNTANGYFALHNNITGSSNTANGFASLPSNLGSFNTASGGYALYQNISGDNNTAFGLYSLYLNVSGDLNTAIGYMASVTVGNLTNATAIGSNALVNASNKVVIGDATVTSIGGYAAWTNFSDARLKENIVYKKDVGLQFINKLQTVSYSYRADALKHRRDGLIAQDVDKTLKDLGLQFSGLVVDDDKDKTMNLSYGDFVIPLINAVQELSRQNNEMKNEINQLKTAIEALKK